MSVLDFTAIRRALIGLIAAIVVLPALSASGQTQELKPYKDELFAYPAIVSREADDRYVVVDYNEIRDINGRDQIPERRVKSQYISTAVRKVQADLTLKTDAGTIRHFAVGKTDGARVIAVYLHGQGGSRKQGVDDFTFGGNFNRIKNLMAANGGLYLSPDFSDFAVKGASEIAALISYYAAKSPGAKIIVACGSMGGSLCWKLADNAQVANRLSGLMLLGSLWDDSFTTSAAFKAKVPIFFGQGSRDPVFPIDKQEAFFRSILAKSARYPARFVRFETGNHGTPIRMTDWRDAINWMIAVAR